MEEYPKPEQHWFDADKNSGSEPSKKRNTNELNVYHDSGKIDKKPTGILKDLKKLNRYIMFKGIQLKEEDTVVLWSDVEAIINKYLNP